MAETVDRSFRRAIHPVHAVLIAATIPLFLGALLSDWAYSSTYEPQWKNFASWLIVGGLLFAVLALLWALIELLRADKRGGGALVYFLLVLATFVVGVINALVHAKDAWAAMPGGLILSLIGTVLAFAAVWIGFSGLPAGGTR